MKHHTIRFANWLTKLNNWSNIITISLATTIFVIIVVLLLSLKRRKFFFFKRSLKKTNIIKNNGNKQSIQDHYWFVNDLFMKPTYCNVCESVMVSGVSCIYCNLYADEKCLKKAEKMFKCKQICECAISENDAAAVSPESNMLDINHNNRYTKNWNHHWIKGNLKLNSVCFFCNEDAGLGPNLNDFKCVWCQRCAHEKCLNSISTLEHDECDFGPMKRLILKPNLIELSKSQLMNITLEEVKFNSNLIENGQLTLTQYNTTPLFVFANPKSGSNDADLIVSHLATVFNPLQVFYLFFLIEK
jgi:diacylglycerol kinase (ATP)